MANINIDSDIQYYTAPLEERIDELEEKLKSVDHNWSMQMQDVDDQLMELTNQITGLLALLKSIGD